MSAPRQTSLCVIPAKGRSTRIPRKNLAMLAGKPMLLYTIEAALGSGVCDEVVVSTEDAEIAALARQAGAAVPYLRDAALAADSARVVDVALNALDRFQDRGCMFDLLCVMLPSSPLREAQDVCEAKQIIDADPAVDSVLSVTRYSYPPQWALHIRDDGTVSPRWPEYINRRRQEIDELVYENGAVYWTRVDGFRQRRSQYGGRMRAYPMPPERGLDIDYPEQLAWAEFLLTRNMELATT